LHNRAFSGQIKIKNTNNSNKIKNNNKILNFDDNSIKNKLNKQDSKKRVQFDEEENIKLI